MGWAQWRTAPADDVLRVRHASATAQRECSLEPQVDAGVWRQRVNGAAGLDTGVTQASPVESLHGQR